MDLAVDVDKARAFVLAQGTARDAARLAGLFGRTQPEREVVKELERLQNPDGGFPLRQQPGGPSSVDATCCVLAQLRDLPPLAGSPMAARAVAFLRRSQAVDGSWTEAGAYLTARAAYTLVVMEPTHIDPIVRAAKWLRASGPDLQAHSPALYLAAAVWRRVLGPDASEPSSAYEGLAGRELSATELAGWLTTFVELGLDARWLPLVLRLLERLAALQQPDGSWPADEGGAVEATLQALRVFRGFAVA